MFSVLVLKVLKETGYKTDEYIVIGFCDTAFGDLLFYFQVFGKKNRVVWKAENDPFWILPLKTKWWYVEYNDIKQQFYKWEIRQNPGNFTGKLWKRWKFAYTRIIVG